MQVGQYDSRLRQLMREHEEALCRLMADACLDAHTKNTCEIAGNLGAAGLDLYEGEQKATTDGPIEAPMHSSRPRITPCFAPEIFSLQFLAANNGSSQTRAALPIESLVFDPNRNTQIGTKPVAQEQLQAFDVETDVVGNVPVEPRGDKASHDSDKAPPHQFAALQSVDLFPSEAQLCTFIREHNKFGRITAHLEPLRRALHAWHDLQEPVRTGHLVNLVSSMYFEGCLFVVIFVSCAFTVNSTNWEMANINGKEPLGMKLAGAFFLLLYTIELILKLTTHRLYFFLQQRCGMEHI